MLTLFTIFNFCISIYFLGKLSFYFIYFTFSIVPILLIFSNMVLTPIEKLIQHFYFLKAKNKIALCSNLKVIAITGSYGKTSTKLFIESLLRTQYLVKCPKYANTLMGICSYINKNLTPYDEVLLLEFGVDKINGMDKFLNLVIPDISIVTYIGEMHLTTFKTIENILKEKMKLLYSAKEIGFYNKDCNILNDLSLNNDSVKGYSKNDINISKINQIGISLSFHNEIIHTNLFGKHNISNISCAITVATYLGISIDSIKEGLKNLIKPEHRLEKIVTQERVILDDSYNSNVDGMKEAIDTLLMFKGSNCIISPGIIEQGEQFYQNNFLLGEYMVKVDNILLVGISKDHPLYKGICNKRFDRGKVFFFKTFKDAYDFVKRYNIKNLLIANDKEDLFLN